MKYKKGDRLILIRKLEEEKYENTYGWSHQMVHYNIGDECIVDRDCKDSKGYSVTFCKIETQRCSWMLLEEDLASTAIVNIENKDDKKAAYNLIAL
jgi:hypothetical protein